MKVIFFVLAIVASSITYAQSRNTIWVKPLTPDLQTNSYRWPKLYTVRQSRPKLIQYTCGMPVIKPDVVYIIPNPLLTYKPTVMTEEQFRMLVLDIQKRQQLILK